VWAVAAGEVDPSAVERLRLQEGRTPLIPLWAGGPGDGSVFLKLEYVSPTLSFKDRGAVVLAAAALEAGAELAVCDSSGNAGAAAAAHFARAGIPLEVYAPASASAAKLTAVEFHGGRLVRVDGPRSAVAGTAIGRVTSTGAFYASHVYNPVFTEGTKVFAFEVVDQLAGRGSAAAPDAVVVPVGNGSLLLGAAQGFAALAAAGRIERSPRIVGVQAAASAPLVGAFARGESQAAPVVPGPTIADGIAISAPPRAGEILAAVRATGGTFVAVDDDAITAAQRELALVGVGAEPTGAVALAGLRTLDRVQWPGPTVVAVTGAAARSAADHPPPEVTAE
jgi:threonine synthase